MDSGIVYNSFIKLVRILSYAARITMVLRFTDEADWDRALSLIIVQASSIKSRGWMGGSDEVDDVKRLRCVVDPPMMTTNDRGTNE